jgi:hypothetical protein
LIDVTTSMLSVLMILPSAEARLTERLSAIWSAASRSPFCLIEHWKRHGPGLPNARPYPSSLETAAAVMVRRSHEGSLMPSRLPIVGISWKIRAEPFLDAVSKSMRQIRQAVGSNVVDPKLLTYAEKLQYEGYLLRQETNEAIQELAKSGTSIRQIVRQTGHSRKLVRDVLRGQRLDVFRTRPSALDSWLPWLNERWDTGSRNALALWREMRAEGFVGQRGIVSQWAQRRRLAEKAGQSGLMRTPSARVLARLMTSAQDGLGKSDAILVAVIENCVP